MRNCFLPLNHLTIIPSATFPEGDIFCLSQSEVAGCATMYLYEFACFCNDISDLVWLVLCGEQN